MALSHNIPRSALLHESPMQCNFSNLTTHLLRQWHALTQGEVEQTGYIKQRIARLIERKYEIHAFIIENYLANLERTLPL